MAKKLVAARKEVEELEREAELTVLRDLAAAGDKSAAQKLTEMTAAAPTEQKTGRTYTRPTGPRISHYGTNDAAFDLYALKCKREKAESILAKREPVLSDGENGETAENNSVTGLKVTGTEVETWENENVVTQKVTRYIWHLGKEAKQTVRLVKTNLITGQTIVGEIE